MAKKKHRTPDIYNPMASLSGRRLRNAAQALVDLQVKPQLGALNAQRNRMLAQGKAQQERASGMYQALVPAQQQAVQNAQNASSALAQQLAAIGQQSQQAIQAAQSQSAIGAPDDAGQSARVAQEFASQRAFAAGTGAVEDKSAVINAATGTGLANAALVATPLRQNDTMKLLATQLSDRLAPVEQQAGEINAGKGKLFTEALGNLRQQQFENRVTMRGLGLNEAEFKERARSNKAQERLAAAGLQVDMHNASVNAYEKAQERKRKAREAGMDVNRFGYTAKQWRKFAPKQRQRIQINYERGVSKARKSANGSKTGTGHDWSPPSQQRTFRSQAHEALTFAQQFRQQNPNMSRAELAQRLLQGVSGDKKAGESDVPSFDSLAVKVALDIAYDGHLWHGTGTDLHRNGIKIKPLGFRTFKDFQRKARSGGAAKHPHANPGAGA